MLGTEDLYLVRLLPIQHFLTNVKVINSYLLSHRSTTDSENFVYVDFNNCGNLIVIL